MRLALVLVLATTAFAASSKLKLKTTVGVDPKSGRLVRRTAAVAPRVIQPLAILSKSVESRSAGGPQQNEPKRVPVVVPPEKIRQLVEEKARQHGVDPLLVDSVIQVESAYNPYAVSPKGAQGLMQLMPGTARTLGVTNSLDPAQNIDGGVRYLKYLKTLFDDERLVLAAYNAGEGAVQRYGWIPPYNETQNYVYEVGRRYGQARRNSLRREAPKQEAQAAPERKPIEEFVDAEGRVHLVVRED